MLALLGFSALNYMPVILVLTLFIAVLMSLSRAWSDSEMVVWLSSGQPLTAWIMPVLRFSFPVILAIALLSAVLTPWANLKSSEYKEKLNARNDTSQVSPGAFREGRDGGRVVFVEAVANDFTQLRNVFAASTQNGKFGVIMSSSGHQEFAPNGDRFMVLEKGRRYEVEPGSPEFKIMEYERYIIRTEDSTIESSDPLPKTMPIWELVRQKTDFYRAELLWRVSQPFSALLLVLLAIPLSFVNPRSGRSANILMAILIYTIYNNLISVSQSWVMFSKLSFWIGVWAVHLLMALLVALLFYRRVTPKPFWRRGRT
ncbi:MAG: Lipopolysaccharide export system permease protein LptF [Betaproteobacteria bacterium ADurb.Bin341]|nr:MAG: Lipopolysaccharide export system permease protein LptF [Betaproteobacteria bacterium ADurb.Bin341]